VVAAFEPEPWRDFGVATAGAAAALAGLLFVAVSINLREITSRPQLPARAAATLGLLVMLLLVGVFLVAPGQTMTSLGTETVVLGVLYAAGTIAGALHRHRGRHAVWVLASLVLQAVPGVLLIAGGISMLVGSGGGLYWVMAAVATGFAAAVASSWVLLVQISAE